MTTIPFLAPQGDPETGAWVGALQAAMPGERVRAGGDCSHEEKNAASFAIVANPDPRMLDEFPRLRWVHSVWAGVERLVAAIHARAAAPLQIVRLVDPELTATMAEAVLAWTLFLHRDMPSYARQQAQRVWQPLPYVPARERHVSVLGLGELGAASARRLAAAGFAVCGWSRARKSIEGVACYAGDDELARVLGASDIVVCLLPLTPLTQGLLNAETLARLPRGASLINFSRGRVIDEDALLAALERGQIDHAVLDVFALEPLPAASWQWQHPRLTVLPHCTGPTTLQTAARIVAANVRRFRETGEIPANVDPGRGY